MPRPKGDIIVAGHICLDLIPEITVQKNNLGELLKPGKLLNVGPVLTSTGGAVANTGLGLQKLGYPVRLMGKVGADPFGDVVLDILRDVDPSLAASMVVDERSNTSYTVVISPPGIDRVFMHCPGANDTYGAEDLQSMNTDGAVIFHFGYPPLMRRMYENDGEELERVLRCASSVVTTIDMAMPDPDSDAGRADWKKILLRALPLTDVFLPSFDEIAAMLGMPGKELNTGSLRQISDWLINAGAAVVAIKLGSNGIYVRTTPDAKRLERLAAKCRVDRDAWRSREVISTCFEVDVVGTTGSGDATIAGFLAELSEGGTPEAAATFATAVGACACEGADATSGLRSRREILARISTGWGKRTLDIDSCEWLYNNDNRIWYGGFDKAV